MIIHALSQYYTALLQQGKISKPGWCIERISYALRIGLDGELLDVVELRSKQESHGKKTIERPQPMQVPERPKDRTGSKIVFRFLCDNSGYLLGFDAKGKPERAQLMFQASKQMHLQLLSDVSSDSAKAVISFFEKWQPEIACNHPAVLPCADKLAQANIVFLIERASGILYAHEDPEICSKWDAYLSGQSNEYQTRCLVTGEIAPIARIHPKIQLPKGQSMGVSLVSFNRNNPAYESYGKEDAQGYNAPISEDTAFAYTTALNHLVSDKEHMRLIGNDTLIYWAEDASTEAQKLFASFALSCSDDVLISETMKHLALGKPVEQADIKQPFYVLCLSPNTARASVRFFLRDEFGHMLKNCEAHYKRLEIVRSPREPAYLSIPRIIAETINPKSSEKRPIEPLSGAVLRSVLTGAPYPKWLFTNILMRIRAERDVNYARAAIIKAYLIKNENISEEDLTVGLNQELDTQAYVLGQLFSVLEQIQEAANKSSDIKQRFFASACGTPVTVFPTLLRLSTHHLAKLEKGWAISLEKDLTALLGKLSADSDPFPANLNLRDQGLFILGYYHRNETRYAGKQKEDIKDGSNL